jgi:hypothetical protein
MHEFDVGLIGDDRPVDVGQRLGAVRAPSRLFSQKRQRLRVFILNPHILLSVFIQ